MSYFIAFICVLGISLGQLLFKSSAICFNSSGTYFDLQGIAFLFLAFSLYGITTLGWIWVLQKMDLAKVYPLMALAFLLVPIGSYLFLNEKINTQCLLGALIIIGGVILSVKS